MDDKPGIKAHHYRCRACGHAIDQTPEQHLALMRMTPVCPECGSVEVESTGRTVKPPKVGPAILVLLLIASSVWAGDARAPVIYVPKSRHLSVPECMRYLDRLTKERGDYDDLTKHGRRDLADQLSIGNQDFCRWYGGTDIAEPCAGGYHQESQRACYGYGAAEIPTFRTVCHRDSNKGAKEPCGLECANPTENR